MFRRFVCALIALAVSNSMAMAIEVRSSTPAPAPVSKLSPIKTVSSLSVATLSAAVD